mmetsp:Transcript_15606/g.39904  ORF Transcript_15606/g.39904 Transcript_15606/m.39904 type:complete len:122 (-) Transcript_15606:190-555(-)|eukprot:CAMPEP_0177650984 /NCGR_PEP_ID=MMETSP0447-20121125/12267_1 /TAXON_ID=0 /ORGANISM="Stygamoeba regulata, Strain BSH-02190019" /LENGTH=121 /DNA_ID=CAMNT_0019153957 /DNA_START=37 /DNA_END=402 /DNA_ORIENTATION=-
MPKDTTEYSNVLIALVVSPNEDGSFDFPSLMEKIRTVQMEGLTWSKSEPGVEDFHFGMKRMLVSCQITDKVSMGEVTKALQALGRPEGERAPAADDDDDDDDGLFGEISIESFDRADGKWC